MKFNVINLGCVRNLVDAQNLIACLQQKKNTLVPLEQAEAVIINTCGFIEDAKKESIDMILDMVELKKKGRIQKVIIAGCLSQRYYQELSKEFRGEVDAILGVPQLEDGPKVKAYSLTPQHYRYVKICEGCYHFCSFCAIPRIKGRLQSRTMESILEEIRFLDEQGVTEVILIGQDITAYGLDLYQQKSLTALLIKILQEIKQIRWIRLLYTFPSHINEDLLELMAEDNQICRYVDVPLQHINTRLLKRMNRPLTKRSTISLIKWIRRIVPEVGLRTSFIVGFPGETEEIFQELIDFVKATRFEKMGVFTYSKEENTPAYRFQPEVAMNIKKNRWKKLMNTQKRISKSIMQAYIGKDLEVIIDEKDKSSDNLYLARTEYDAPDVDGLVYVHTKKELRNGQIISVKITDAFEYDLTGEHP